MGVPRQSHKGRSFTHMAETLNGFVRQYGNTRECSYWTTEELQRFQALMLVLRSTELNNLYIDADVKRALRGDEDEHGQRWERLNALAHTIEGGVKVQRDGHCHEALMWFVHHVPESVRNALQALLLCLSCRTRSTTAVNMMFAKSMRNRFLARTATEMQTSM